MKLLKTKTIAAAITAVVVAGVTMAASAPAASAWEPEPDFTYQADASTSYGVNNGVPFISSISLDPESIQTIFSDPEFVQAVANFGYKWALRPVCSGLSANSPDIADTLAAALNDKNGNCVGVALANIRQEQQLQYAQNPITMFFYPSGVTWYQDWYPGN